MVNNGSLLRILCKFSLCLLFLFRRLLQMGVFNCQLYNNLGLCCFYAQQYDMTLSSFERALALVSSDEEQADIWYNLGHVAVVSRHSKPSVTCVRVCRWERAWPSLLEQTLTSVFTQKWFDLTSDLETWWVWLNQIKQEVDSYWYHSIIHLKERLFANQTFNGAWKARYVSHITPAGKQVAKTCSFNGKSVRTDLFYLFSFIFYCRFS